MAMLGLRYDLRAPTFGSATHAELYAACLDQAAWGDERGFDFLVLSEHHAAEDGYIPAPVTMAIRPLRDASIVSLPARHPRAVSCACALVGASGNAGMISSANVRNASFEPVGSTSST